MNKKRFKALFGAIYVAVIVVVVILQISSEQTGVLYSFDNTLKDSMYQNGGLVNTNICVIGIDEDTLSEYGNYDTWIRSKLAELINLLCKDEKNAPAVIGIDIGLYSPKDDEDDAALAEAIKKAGNVVLNETVSFDTAINQQEGYTNISSTRPVLVEEPLDIFLSGAASVGHCNFSLDEDGYVRHAVGSIIYNNYSINSFAYEVAKYYMQSSPGDEYKNTSYYIDYTGKPRDYYGSFGSGSSLSKVLDGAYPASAFRDCIVLVGAYASGLPDFYYTPVDRTAQMYGVEINANVVDQILKGVYKNELEIWQEVLICIILGLIIAALHTFLWLRFSLPVNVVLFGGYALSAYLLYKSGTVMPLFFPLFLMLILMALGITLNMVSEFTQRRALASKFNKYVSPDVAAAITNEKDLHLGGVQRDIAVMFIDIRGFTTLSENMTPTEVVNMINKYLSVTSKAIFNHKGTIDKFIGDATMAIYNAPLEMEDYEYQPVVSAIEMQDAAKNLSDKAFTQKVQFGIGINCGDAVVGNIGTDFRMDYTAIGDVVNTASRIEGQSKAGEILVSEAMYDRLKDRVIFECIGDVQLKGKKNAVKLYKVIGLVNTNETQLDMNMANPSNIGK